MKQLVRTDVPGKRQPVRAQPGVSNHTSMDDTVSISDLTDFALALAHRGGKKCLEFLASRSRFDRKADLSPVTLADRKCEAYMWREIEEHFPGHAILGEEFGTNGHASAFRWLLDPIDGTVSFIHGVPLYGTTVGVEHNGEPVVGVVHFPALGETVWAQKEGQTFWNGRPAWVSSVRDISAATVVLTDRSLFARAGVQDRYDQLGRLVHFERGWGDCYGRVLVATGRADILLDPIDLKPWDVCPIVPIIEGAGGKFTDWANRRVFTSGNGVITNGHIHDEVIRVLTGEKDRD